jgi:hypothetical protein
MAGITNILCGLIGLVAVALGTAVALHPAPIPAELDEARLQRLAERSCKCERSAGPGGKKACWSEFDRQLPPPGESGTDAFTACIPIEMEIRCGGTGEEKHLPGGSMAIDQGPCVTMRYNYIGGGGSVILCTQAEAAAVERVFNSEVRPDRDGQYSTPIANKLARDLAAGKPIPNVSGPGSCTSS